MSGQKRDPKELNWYTIKEEASKEKPMKRSKKKSSKKSGKRNIQGDPLFYEILKGSK